MSSETKLLITLENGIKRITFNRPKTRNSVDPETFELFSQAMLDSAQDESRVIILSGTGEAFCSGADLSAFNAMDAANYDVTASLRERTNPAILAMRAMPKPIIARVHGPAAGIGYASGAGGAVVQTTSKSNGVTLNKTCGQITTHGAALAANTTVSFVVTNSAVAATDAVIVNLKSGNATAGAYLVFAEAIGAGTFRVNVRNMTAGSLSETLVINFAVVKAVAA